MQNELDKINNNGWNVSKKIWNKLDDYERSYLIFELSNNKSKQVYRKRLDALRFKDKKKILDAGCGFGQWSIILSEKNKIVYGIDTLKRRIDIAKTLKKQNKASNCFFTVGNMEKTRFKKNYFDLIFCNGSIWFTNCESTLNEFKRILKRNGRIYFSFANFGWYLKLLIKDGIIKKNSINFRKSIEFIIRFLQKKKSRVFLTKKFIERLLPNQLEILDYDFEGKIGLTEKVNISFYESRFLFFPSMNEILLRKKS